MPAEDRPAAVSRALIDPHTKTKQTYSIRSLVASDLDAFLDLHRVVLGTLGHPSCLDERDQVYMAQKLSGEGAVVGAFLDGRLLGYACLRFSGGRGPAYAEACGIHDHHCAGVAEMDGAAVDPDYRRTGVYQELLETRERVATESSIRHLLGIVSVHNPRSLTGVLAAGYRTRALYNDSFGPNLVIHKDLQVSYRPDDGDQRLRIRINDIRGHTRALATARWGCALSRNDALPHVEYAHCLSGA